MGEKKSRLHSGFHPLIQKWFYQQFDQTTDIQDQAWPLISNDILHVKTPLATITDLQNDGYDSIVIQPTHVSMGEEFLDLHTYVKALMDMGTFKKPKYKPFHKIALGRPALGTHGTKFPYTEDIAILADARGVFTCRISFEIKGHA